MHELGHVLGLSDYGTCDGLRVRGSGSAATNPDVQNQHYSLMYNASDRECRPMNQEGITERCCPDRRQPPLPRSPLIRRFQQQILKELRPRLDSGHEQVIAGASARDVQQMPLRAVDLL